MLSLNLLTTAKIMQTGTQHPPRIGQQSWTIYGPPRHCALAMSPPTACGPPRVVDARHDVVRGHTLHERPAEDDPRAAMRPGRKAGDVTFGQLGAHRAAPQEHQGSGSCAQDRWTGRPVTSCGIRLEALGEILKQSEVRALSDGCLSGWCCRCHMST